MGSGESVVKRRRASMFAVLAALFVAAFVAACGGSDEGGGSTDANGESYVQFAIAPDPLWDYMKSQGMIAKFGEETGVNITQLSSFDEFGLFAGGHADIVSTGTYETPNFDGEGVETVTFGKYNMNKEQMFSADPSYKTTKDFPPGCKIAVLETTGVFNVWSPLVEALDGRRMTEDPQEDSDIPIVVAEEVAIPTLIEKGEVCAGIYNPFSEAFINDARTGKLHPMYDGKAGSQLFAEEYAPGHDGVNSNMFVARKEWFDEHPKEVAAFLKLWQQGVDLWYKDRDKIVDAAPGDWGVTQPGDEVYVKSLLDKFDFNNKDVYLDKKWIEDEKKVFDLVKEAGGVFKDDDQYFPEHAIIDPKTGDVIETVGGKDSE